MRNNLNYVLWTLFDGCAVWRVLTTLAAHKCTEFIIIAKENVTESQLSDDTRRVLAVLAAWSKVLSARSHKNDDDTSHFKAPSPLSPLPLSGHTQWGQ